VAQQQSPLYFRAKNTLERSYWRHENFKALLKPQLRLQATVPTVFRAINPITQPDGSILFRRISQANNSLGLNLIQNVGLTGGQFRLTSALQRTDNFAGPESSFFLSTPFTLTYLQNSLLYNDLRWRKQLEPLRYEVATQAYREELEETALQAATAFLDALVAQVGIQIAAANQANADTLLAIAKERYALGTVARSDLLQLELNQLKAQNAGRQATIQLAFATRRLRLLMAQPTSDTLVLAHPARPSQPSQASYDLALDMARNYRAAVLSFRAKRLEADQQVAQAQGQNSLELGILANLGTQQTAPRLTDAYRNLQNQQYIGVTLDMPLKDWGYRKSQIRLAKANRELVEVEIQQDEQAFEQEIFLQVLTYNQQYAQLALAEKADTVAQERLRITKERYLVGKLTVTDLNLALEEAIRAQEAYIGALRSYWLAYYTLRRLTLYDFMQNRPVALPTEP
jgi:outer membrane protein TolC